MIRAPFFLAITLGPSLSAQTLEGKAPSVSTKWTSKKSLSNTDNLSRRFLETPSTHIQDSGGMGKLNRFSIRGASPDDTKVFLEGIPLSTSSLGGVDMAPFLAPGLKSMEVERGGFQGPGGSLHFSLQDEVQPKSSIGYGSYQTLSASHEIPHAAFAFEQSENNFPYTFQEQKLERKNNESQILNLRGWNSYQDWKFLTQILYSDQELPGGVSLLTPGAESQTFTPTVAALGNIHSIQTKIWSTYQEQKIKEPSFSTRSLNRSLHSGIELKRHFSLPKDVEYELSIKWLKDKLFSDTFESPYRHQISSTSIWTLSPHEILLINPRIQMEYISDLSDPLSLQGGIGFRQLWTSDFFTQFNFDWVNRAPNINELYYKIPGLAEPNPNLERQFSLQSDFGYEVRLFSKLRFQQSVYFDRTVNLLQSSLESGIYQVQNFGTALRYGLENELWIRPLALLDFQAQYTLQNSSLGSQKSFYQPTHRFQLNPVIFPDAIVKFSFPLSARSSVVTPPFRKTLNKQWDLSAHLDVEWKRLLFHFEACNLLSWRRIEVQEYPLSEEPSYLSSLSLLF